MIFPRDFKDELLKKRVLDVKLMNGGIINGKKTDEPMMQAF